MKLLLHTLGARLILQELPALLELELSDLCLAAQGVVFPFDVVQLQRMLHTVELLLKLELVELPLRLVQLLRAWLCGEHGETGCLVPQLVELPLRMREFLGTFELLTLFPLVESVDVFLLDHLRPLVSELVTRCPGGGSRQKHSGQQKAGSHGPEECHRLTSVSGRARYRRLSRVNPGGDAGQPPSVCARISYKGYLHDMLECILVRTMTQPWNDITSQSVTDGMSTE